MRRRVGLAVLFVGMAASLRAETNAELQAQVLSDFDRGIPIPSHPHASIPEGSEYHVPTLAEYLVYRWRQRKGPVIRTESIVLRGKSGTIRRVSADHLAEKWL